MTPTPSKPDLVTLAEAKCADMGYVLVPEPPHPDSPHASEATPSTTPSVREALERIRNKLASIRECQRQKMNHASDAAEKAAAEGTWRKYRSTAQKASATAIRSGKPDGKE